MLISTLCHAIAADQRVGRAVVLQLRRRPRCPTRDDALGQHLAQFHAPLVEGVDVPDSALSEDVVLIEGNQRAQRPRRELVGQDGIRWAVAFANAERRLEVGRAFGLQFLGGLAESQRLGLREDVRHQVDRADPSAGSAAGRKR
jgi:hypothetical protein